MRPQVLGSLMKGVRGPLSRFLLPVGSKEGPLYRYFSCRQQIFCQRISGHKKILGGKKYLNERGIAATSAKSKDDGTSTYTKFVHGPDRDTIAKQGYKTTVGNITLALAMGFLWFAMFFNP